MQDSTSRDLHRRALLGTAAGLATLAAPAQLAAQDRRVTLVVPFAPGGVNDAIGRIVANALGPRLGQVVVVENRAGANGVVGLREVSRSRPDGTVLAICNDGALSIPAALDPAFPIELGRDLSGVARVGTFEYFLLVHRGIPATTVQEFIAFARARPDEVASGTPGIGSSQHLATEMLAAAADIRLNHVPYRGAGPALNDLLAGTIGMSWQSAINVRGLVADAGRQSQVRVLGVAAEQRTGYLPDVPTMIESGLPGFVATSWIGVFGPPGLPDAVRVALSTAIAEAVQDPATRARLDGAGFDVAPMPPAGFEAFIRRDIARLREFGQRRGITLSAN